jgi:hypothetical protein
VSHTLRPVLGDVPEVEMPEREACTVFADAFLRAAAT